MCAAARRELRTSAALWPACVSATVPGATKPSARRRRIISSAVGAETPTLRATSACVGAARRALEVEDRQQVAGLDRAEIGAGRMRLVGRVRHGRYSNSRR